MSEPEKNSALSALQRLRDGNARFVAGLGGREVMAYQTQMVSELVQQEPFAAILGCSDSRVPVELVFDQGLGDLFVIRVAGNIVAPSQVGSVEFAVEQFGIKLVVVLGHTRCGAVQATVDALQRTVENHSRNLTSIVDRIRPSVEGLMHTELRNDRDALVRHAVRANVRASANQLRHGSEVLERHVRDHGLLVVGAEYSLETGTVEFIESAT